MATHPQEAVQCAWANSPWWWRCPGHVASAFCCQVAVLTSFRWLVGARKIE